MMKAILLISLMFTLALGEDINDKPCQKSPNNNAYNTFQKRHILPESFDKNKWTLKDWRNYLNKTGLCNRSQQTFITEDIKGEVEKICQGDGKNLRNNLCISDSPIKLYHLIIKDKCTFAKPKPVQKHVIVACDKIDNVCHPVHFHGIRKKLPKKQLETCR